MYVDFLLGFNSKGPAVSSFFIPMAIISLFSLLGLLSEHSQDRL